MSLCQTIKGFKILCINPDLEVWPSHLGPSLMEKMQSAHRTMHRVDLDRRSQARASPMRKDEARWDLLNGCGNGHGRGLME